MPRTKYDDSNGCPIVTGLNVLQGKAKGTLVFQLLGGSKDLRELRKAIPEISTRVLQTELAELFEDGIAESKDFGGGPDEVMYSLTSFGWRLKHIIDSIRVWGVEYQRVKNPPPPPPPVEETKPVKKGRKPFKPHKFSGWVKDKKKTF